MNLSNPKFQDERVRQAITLSIDTALIRSLIYDDLAKTLPLHPWPLLFDAEPQLGSPELGRWFGRYDPDEAKKLLAAAGAEDLEFDAIYYTYGQYITQQTEIALSNFNDVGIKMNARSVDYTEFNSTWVPAKLEEASTSAWLTVGFDADNYFFNSVHSQSPGNRWRLNDPQVDAWAEQQQLELDPDARKEILRTMWDYFLEQMFWPPFASGIGIQTYQPWLRGIRFGGPMVTSASYYDWGDQVAAAWIDK
jgi:peptide/nickel transport system substrate-binding protein